MKKIVLSVVLLPLFSSGFGQNVGIGTLSPLYPLHVAGTARATTISAIDGRFDSHIRLGEDYNAAYKLYVGNGKAYFADDVRIDGGVGLGVAADPSLRIKGVGSAYFSQNIEAGNQLKGGFLTVANAASIGTNLNVMNNLSVSNDLLLGADGIVDGNFRINGRIGVNGATNGSYGLIVNNANTYLQGNTTVTGSTTLQGPVSIQGKGSVRSDGSSSLRIGFSTATFHGNVGGKQTATINVNIASFAESGDIRPVISDVISTGSNNEPENIPLFNWYISAVNPANNTCTITVYNTTGLSKLLSVHFTVLAVAKD